GIAAVGAVSAIVAAEVGKRDEDFARIRDDAWAELLFQCARDGEQFGEELVIAGQELNGDFRREWMAVEQMSSQICGRHLVCGPGPHCISSQHHNSLPCCHPERAVAALATASRRTPIAAGLRSVAAWRSNKLGFLAAIGVLRLLAALVARDDRLIIFTAN